MHLKLRIKYVILGIIIVILVDVFGLLSHLFEIDYYTKFSYPLDVNINEILVALKNGKQPPASPINKYNYRFKIKSEKKCWSNVTNNYEHIVILFVIKSAFLNFEKRQGIRNSWAWENRFSDVAMRRVFLLGTSEDGLLQDRIDDEYAEKKDIVQANFFDSYYNNTIKTMMGFRWVTEYCPKTEFIMFADDDMYISTKNLLKFLRNPFNTNIGFRKLLRTTFNHQKITTCNNCDNHSDKGNLVLSDLNTISGKLKSSDVLVSSRESGSSQSVTSLRRILELDPALSAFDGRLFAGYVFFSSPMRHKPSKWYVTLEEYPFSKYPPYVTAGAYVMSYPALLDVYLTSMYTKHFKFDDIYLGIIAKKCGISPLHNKNFYFWKKPYDKDGYRDVIASHGFGNPLELQKVWEEQRSLGHA